MPLDRRRLKVLCFDVDGTLSDTDDVMVDRLSSLLSGFRIVFPQLDVHRLSRRMVMSLESPAQYVYGIPDRINLDGYLYRIVQWINHLGIYNKRISTFWLIPGVKEALAYLRKCYRLSIVSARDEQTTQLFLEQYQMMEWFEYVATAMTCMHTKPYPDPILWVAKKMEVLPEQVLMIGDTTVDMRAAKAAGAQAVGVLSGFGEKQELIQSGADLIIGSVADLPEILCPQCEV